MKDPVFLKKVIVRRLPPNWLNGDFVKQVCPENTRSYFEKADVSFGVGATSRGYIWFSSEDDAWEFKQSVDGYEFVDSKGICTTALVEYAPCQYTPKELLSDALNNTFSATSEYKKFVSSIEANDTGDSIEDYLSKLEERESKKKDAGPAAPTPLIQFILDSRDEEQRDPRQRGGNTQRNRKWGRNDRPTGKSDSKPHSKPGNSKLIDLDSKTPEPEKTEKPNHNTHSKPSQESDVVVRVLTKGKERRNANKPNDSSQRPKERETIDKLADFNGSDRRQRKEETFNSGSQYNNDRPRNRRGDKPRSSGYDNRGRGRGRGGYNRQDDRANEPLARERIRTPPSQNPVEDSKPTPTIDKETTERRNAPPKRYSAMRATHK